MTDHLETATPEQLAALRRVWERPQDGPKATWEEFRTSAQIAFGDCVMVPWCGMVLGIETDGYTHS